MQSYWSSVLNQRLTRRRALVASGGGAFAAALSACGGDDAPAASQGSSEQLDWTKGNPGGKLSAHNPTWPVGLDLVTRTGAQTRIGGLTHSGLLTFRAGKSGVEQGSLDMEPDAAQALPEQPNETTYVFKLRPGIKFHNGRAVTAEDVKYSFDRYASLDASVHKLSFAWLDRIETPDAQTITFRTKEPNADSLWNLSQYQSGYILAKEHEESNAVNERLVGTGPYTWVRGEEPVSIALRRNPDYFLKPYPYFDEITFYVIQDDVRRVADFITKQVQFTFWMSPEEARQIRQSRPEAPQFGTPSSSVAVFLRVDQAPWTDKRVRQALSRGMNRKQIADGVHDSEGESDTALSHKQSVYWGARKPADLKAAANYVYDPASARQLLSAAGITSPIQMNFTQSAATGATFIRDTLVLAQAKWREDRIAEFNPVVVPTGVFNDTVLLGRFDGIAAHFGGQQPIMGTWMKARFWAPPEGPRAPSLNNSFMNNPTLSRLIDRNLTQFNIEERRTTFREIDELMAEEMYRPSFVTRQTYWFTDPSIKNASVYDHAQIGTAAYLKYWWLG